VLPEHLMTYLYALVSMLMAAFIQFFITYSLAMMAFWILEISTIVFIVTPSNIFSAARCFHRHHAGRNSGGTEMDALSTMSCSGSDRHFSRATARF